MNSVADTSDGFCDSLSQGFANQDCTLRDAVTAAKNYNAINSNAGAIINLATNATYSLTTADNSPPEGANGLPVISSNITINANDQLNTAAEYQNLVVAFKNGAPVRLRDIAKAVESAENVKLGAWAVTGGQLKPAVILNVQRQPGANVIQTVDAIKERLPELTAGLPAVSCVLVVPG